MPFLAFQTVGLLAFWLLLVPLLLLYNDHYNDRGGLLDHYKWLALPLVLPAALALPEFCPGCEEEGKKC